MKLAFDAHHLNADGHYLQACLWFAFLYGEPAGKITWMPNGMKKNFAVLLRRCAQEALAGYRQVK